jgi:hypothetical protein
VALLEYGIEWQFPLKKGLKSGNIMLAEFQKRVAQSRNGKLKPNYFIIKFRETL